MDEGVARSFRFLKAAGFLTPEHCAQSLWRLTQGREQVWIPHRGHVYLMGLVWLREMSFLVWKIVMYSPDATKVSEQSVLTCRKRHSNIIIAALALWTPTYLRGAMK